MRFPVVRERVRVQGQSGTFLVLSVDRARAVADLIPVVGGRIEERVPLSSILPLTEEDEPKPDPNEAVSE